MDLLARRLLFAVLPTLIVCGMVYVAVFGSNGLVAWLRIGTELEREQAQLVRLTADNARLHREVRELGGDAVTLERAAAEDLRLVPPESTLYRFR